MHFRSVHAVYITSGHISSYEQGCCCALSKFICKRISSTRLHSSVYEIFFICLEFMQVDESSLKAEVMLTAVNI